VVSSFREAEDVIWSASRDLFAACNSTALPRCCGPREIYGLSRRGNRRINHIVEAPRHVRPRRAV
jgi:hypothetical protein